MNYLAAPDQGMSANQRDLAEVSSRHSSGPPPIFLHCGWRTRGTWIWNRFRGLRGVTGFYEPLSEILAEVTPSTLASISPSTWASGHQDLDRPYFDEFGSLLSAGHPGVPGYQTRFATSDFFAAPDSALPELYQYLRMLLQAARERGEQPVLKFSRSGGRTGWMRRHFPDAVHIVVMRDPFSQFMSALRQFVWHGNGYFLAMPLLLVSMNRHHPLVKACLRHLDARLPDLGGSGTGMASCEAHLRASDPASWYRGFLTYWVATAATISDGMDMVVDSDALICAGPYRQRCEIELARLTGLTVDFRDAEDRDNSGPPDASALRCSEVLRAHAAAEGFLAEQLGPAWADTPVLNHVTRMLARARSRALGDEAVRRALHPDAPVSPSVEPDVMASLLSAIVRASMAERDLSAIRASHSWKITAPMRWLRESLRAS
jgi:hypothetical protein